MRGRGCLPPIVASRCAYNHGLGRLPVVEAGGAPRAEKIRARQTCASRCGGRFDGLVTSIRRRSVVGFVRGNRKPLVLATMPIPSPGSFFNDVAPGSDANGREVRQRNALWETLGKNHDVGEGSGDDDMVPVQCASTQYSVDRRAARSFAGAPVKVNCKVAAASWRTCRSWARFLFFCEKLASWQGWSGANPGAAWRRHGTTCHTISSLGPVHHLFTL